MKKNKIQLLAFLLSLLCISSCTDNEMKYIATMPAEGDFVLTASSNAVVLKQAGAGKHTAIAFTWDSLLYKVSTPVTYTIQLDKQNGDFSAPIEEEVMLNKYELLYTDSVLNKKFLNLLHLTPDVVNKIQVRLKANMAFGNMPAYSNIIALDVTPFSVLKVTSFLYMPGDLSGGWGEYGTKICSKNNDGMYEGYVNANQWANFKFTDKADGSGTFYGSSPSSLYTLDSSTSMWNIWFDIAGYFKINANLNTMTWSKTAITSFCVTGDFNGWSLTANPMTYDAVNKVWTTNCDLTTIGFGIQIIANGDWNYKFGNNDGAKDAGELTLGGGNIMPTAGASKTLTMNLSDPEKFTFTVQ